jgi:hypothetical protein
LTNAAANVSFTNGEITKMTYAALREYKTDFTPRKISVARHAATARFNRKRVNLEAGVRICTSRSWGEKEIGKWLLVERNVVKNSFDDLAQLESFLRTVVLHEIEYLEDAGRS